MEQLIIHLFGDYVTQSDWMANEKTKSSVAAGAHALVYALPFLLVGPSLVAFAVILGTHFVIDRWRLARYVCWAKNFLAPPKVVYDHNGVLMDHRYDDLDRWAGRPIHDDMSVAPPSAPTVWLQRNPPLRDCGPTGYPINRPDWLVVWLLIACDNTLHLAINYSALRFL